MSMMRAALRLATVLALSNNNSSPWPTVAEGRVYDSRLDPTELFQSRERRPVCLVYTDKDRGDTRSRTQKSAPFKRTIDLIVEISVMTLIEDPDTKETVVAQVQTDAELEMWLDILEHQARQTLFYGDGKWPTLWRTMFTRIHSVDSNRETDQGDAGVRFALRKLILEVDMSDDCPPAAVVLAPGDTAPAPTVVPPIAAIIAAVAAGGTTSPYVDAMTALIGAVSVPGSVNYPALERIRFFEKAQIEKRAGVARGPRQAGVAEAHIHD